MVGKVNLSNIERQEQYIEDFILGRRSHRNREATKSLADPVGMSMHRYDALGLYHSYYIVWSLLYERELLRERTRAHSIPTGRSVIVQGLMRALQVVECTESVEGLLAMT